MNEERLITLETGDRESVEFYVLEETKTNGINYLLATDAEEDDEDRDCYILKGIFKAEGAGAIYESVEDNGEVDCLFKIFSELMKDMDVDLRR